MSPPGRFCIVLHTHMPYVEGYGTWPFGEEWLWEAMATSYLPLLDALDAAPGRVTLSLTPVLCDQLEAPGVGERFLAFLRDVRSETHRHWHFVGFVSFLRLSQCFTHESFVAWQINHHFRPRYNG